MSIIYSHSLLKTHKQDLLMCSLQNFYNNDTNLNKMLKILNQETKISLRIIDWFVTNYSKKYNIQYALEKTKETFNVYINYKLQLKGYSKKQFDPFCRRNRIKYYYNDTDFIVTTVGQLNFFKWALSNNIIDYIHSHIEDIERDMNSSYKSAYGLNQPVQVRKKRQELSRSATKHMIKNDIHIIVCFD